MNEQNVMRHAIVPTSHKVVFLQVASYLIEYTQC